MLIRRAFFYWQFIAAAVLPLWLVVGWPIFGAGGWKILGVFVGAVLLGLALLLVAVLNYARKDVRRKRIVSWPDVALLSVWHALIVFVGFYADVAPWVSVLVIVVGVAAFWLSAWELYDAARRRVRTVMTQIDDLTHPVTLAPGIRRDPRGSHRLEPDASVIVVPERDAER
ncbi:MFS transporter [Cryobacterium tepidiphilum]|uniref:MFS transporter n=1 Tax=Cryobacterium tepidiphilum TaxID=2486026 RepID=A0A3M8L1F8_9MICO|nr:MFS transporter [Cryobacterium tepidiphilum]RNE58488.1 MFS transporter [Cryobacterium tepidiphilum]